MLQANEWINPAHLSLEEFLQPEPEDGSRGMEFDWSDGLSLKEMVRRSTVELEKRVLIEALRRTGGNKAKAARLLHMDYTTIHAKIKQYNISLDSEEDA